MGDHSWDALPGQRGHSTRGASRPAASSTPGGLRPQAEGTERAAGTPIEAHIRAKLGIIPSLGDRASRSELAERRDEFLQVIGHHIGQNPTNFEVFSFAIIRVHLAKLGCRIYRDSRSAAHDRGVDLSTNFGVVYQIKELKVLDRQSADAICAELKLNFDEQRFEDGKIVIIIADAAKDVRSYLIDRRVQAISKSEVLRLAANFEDMEDREKVLRVIHEAFSREYRSSVSPPPAQT